MLSLPKAVGSPANGSRVNSSSRKCFTRRPCNVSLQTRPDADILAPLAQSFGGPVRDDINMTAAARSRVHRRTDKLARVVPQSLSCECVRSTSSPFVHTDVRYRINLKFSSVAKQNLRNDYTECGPEKSCRILLELLIHPAHLASLPFFDNHFPFYAIN